MVEEKTLAEKRGYLDSGMGDGYYPEDDVKQHINSALNTFRNMFDHGHVKIIELVFKKEFGELVE